MIFSSSLDRMLFTPYMSSLLSSLGSITSVGVMMSVSVGILNNPTTESKFFLDDKSGGTKSELSGCFG